MSRALPLADVTPLPASGSGPLYRQVKRELQRQIETGRYTPGDTLPSESVIAGTLGVSIGTLRRAVDELVHENVLVRRHGRGTFVALHSTDSFLFQFFHVEPRGDASQEATPHRRELPDVDFIGFVKGRADETEAAALRIKPGDAVLRATNRLSLRGRPVVHDLLVVAAGMFRGLTEKRYRERPSTVYRLYQSDFGISVLRARERVRAVPAGSETARVLGVAAGVPILEVHRVALTFGDRPIEYRVSRINTSAHDYVSTLSKYV
ncbi:GntR family transcriptional regulator [Ramlibacter albus]|uniref:GntR family transcriptional regulator n=1 Tax=Ramlibacter albus TaxID=2079448 RepID=A0A923M9K0_9BURK|nr:GntR family transcriptional regulator [Ramlibacter albus]MBC5765403.1 GntR family transcriptional regulator [Ramlibacter albus]